ncbi:MAG TPA: acetyltransferase [Gammaproteobacteria bacterium]|nr:acetyltransferase [Gammaproteobacteria bacterium]
MRSIVIIGSSGHAKVVIDIVERAEVGRIAGLIDDFRAAGETTLGYPVLGKVGDLPRLCSEHALEGGVVAVGDNFARARLVGAIRATSPDFDFPAAVHPAAILGRDVSVDEGAVVMAGAVVNPCSRLGRFCILNTGASLDHDSTLAEFASLAPGARTGGGVSVEPYAAIGIGAVVVQGVRIGEHAVIGAGATVLEDVPAYSVAHGTPARPVRKREAGEKYL